MDSKSEPTVRISAIKVGNKDMFGYLITDVLAMATEYAIYEIDAEDINKKLRVLIDGINDESERKIADSYIKVKEKYITAKGLLYRSANYGLMRSRVANTLATALAGYHEIALEQFDRLITEINREYKDTFIRRILYVAPGYFLLTVLAIILGAYSLELFQISESPCLWFKVAIAAVIGGVFSLTLNLSKMRFDAEIGKFIFALFGAERISISILAGLICTIGIKSKFIMANLFQDSIEPWALLFVVIVSAFSEKMVPNLIMNVDETAGKAKR